MRRVIIIISLPLLLLTIACNKDDDNQIVENGNKEIIYKPFLWKTPVNTDTSSEVRHNPLFGFNMTFGDVSLINTANSEESRNLTGINNQTGEILWHWSDWFQPLFEGASLSKPISDNEYYRWTTGTRHYTIDLKSGETIMRWRDYENNLSFGSRNFTLPQYSSDAFYINTSLNVNGTRNTKIYRTGITDPTYEEFLELPYDSTLVGEYDWVYSIASASYFQNDNNEYLICTGSQSYEDWYYDIQVNLYNLTTHKWEYTNVPAAEPKQNNGGHSKVYGDKFYFTAGSEMFCYNILSGQQLWKREFPHDFTFSGFEIAEDIMIANCENQVCYGVDIDDGSLVWSSEGSGTSSYLQSRVMNGVAYFSGGGPVALFAKDIHTGRTIWKLEPDLYEQNNATWTSTLNVVSGKNGEKGKIIVGNRSYFYCFEAAR